MESSLRSRKRKQGPSNSDQLDGIFTRRRSQIYVHKTRSGHTRLDSNRSRNLIQSEKRKSKSVVKQEQITSQSSVKDLRARRVFSAAKITDNDDGEVSIADVDLKGAKFDGNLGFLDSVTIAEDVVSIGDVDLKGEFDDLKKINGNPNVLSYDGNLGVCDSVDYDLKGDSEIVVDLGENEVMEAVDDVVQMTPVVTESDQNKKPEETNVPVSVVNDIADAKGSMNKSQSSVSSLRGRKKVFKSPSSFSYRRMLPFLTDVNNDSSNFELVETRLPEQVQKYSNKASNVFVEVSDCTKLADDLFNKAKSMNVGNSIVVQKSNEDVPKDTLDDCVQTTPPDSDIYSQSKIDKTLGVIVKPTSKAVPNLCSQMNVLRIPTSFSHRRLLPFLMSVSGDNSCTLKSHQSLKLEKVAEQNQYQNVSMNESKTDSNSGKPSTKDEKSDSPTSTLIPVDTSCDIIKPVTLVSNDNLLDADGPHTDCSRSNIHAEKADKSDKSDSFIKLEQLSPKNNLKSVEEAASEAIVMSTEQSIDTNDGKERPLLQITPVNVLEINGKNIKSGILKRTPRGCRGICNCLNCTSFRLHAERSFEFSRNQMCDAEEVALDLINDLSSLRNILEKTVSDCNALDIDKEKQVKQACEKASYKEKIARARLEQMNEDLSIHCRSMKLFRPNVTFANKIEEKVISKDHVFGKKSV